MGQESWYLFLDNFKRCLQGTKRFGNSRNHSQTFSDSFGAIVCTHGCNVNSPMGAMYMHPYQNDVVLALYYQKNAIIKKKNEKISLVVICDLVPMFSKTETDTLRSPP